MLSFSSFTVFYAMFSSGQLDPARLLKVGTTEINNGFPSLASLMPCRCHIHMRTLRRVEGALAPKLANEASKGDFCSRRPS